MTSQRAPIVILGAGPAGLGAAFHLARRSCFDVTVLERSGAVGGNAGSFDIAGLRVDYGSHRLHPSCRPEILADIRALLGESLLDRPRQGRIRLRNRWVRFPLQPLDLALHLPAAFMAGVLRDSITKPFRRQAEETFASVLERGLGPAICRDFYFPYARKIWGLPPGELDAEQARRRISAGSLGKMLRKVLRAVPGLKPQGGGRFFYPKDGYGAISEAYCHAARAAGAAIRLNTSVESVELSGGAVAAVSAREQAGGIRLPARQVLSTIPLPALIRMIRPPAPAPILASAGALRYRAMILVYLVLETDRFTEYDAHYFPGEDVPISRLSEPKNYSLAGLPGVTVLCAELPCSPQEPIWQAPDGELGRLVMEALRAAGLPCAAAVREVASRRLEQAYPIYTRGYSQHFRNLDDWVSGIEGLLTFGRQGLFAHDNTHHALAMAYAAGDCLNDTGELDRRRWAGYRFDFQGHVVED